MPNTESDGVGVRRRHRALVAISVSVAAAMLVAACSSSGGGSNAGDTTPATAASNAATGPAAAELPDKYKSSGTIVDASAFDYPPYDFTDASGKYVGLEPEILEAIAPLLGVKVNFTKLAGFASLIPAVSSGRVDVASSSIGVTSDRLKEVGYAQYMVMREGLAVQKGNPHNVSVANLCGHSVAVETGAIEVDEYKALAAKCASAGKPKLDVLTFSSESSQVLAVSSGRVDAVAVGAVTTTTLAKQDPNLEAVSGYVNVGTPPVPIGFAVAPDNAGLANAITAALKQIQKNGTLKSILDKYGVADDLVSIKSVSSTH